METETKVAGKHLGRPVVTGYALGSIGTGIYTTVPTVLLLYYCTEILGIPSIWASGAVFLPKIWGLVWDPVVGNWSDRTHNPLGRRRPFLLVGAIGTSLSFVVLFNAPEATLVVKIAYVIGAYFMMASTYSLFAVPYIAIPAEISDDPRERERLLTWRMTFAMLGVMIGAGAAPHVVAWAGGGRGGYFTMSLVVGVISALGMLATVVAVGYHDSPRASGDTLQPCLSSGLRHVLSHRAFTRLAGAYVLQLTGVGLLTSMTPYFVTQVLGRPESAAGSALAAMLLGTIVALPLWSRVLRRMNGTSAIAVAAMAYATSCFGLLGIHATQGPLRLILTYGGLGLSFAGIQLVPYALLAHLTNAENAADRPGNEGLYTGVWTASEKLGLALGPTVAGLGLWLVGHKSAVAHESARVVQGLHVLIAVGPSLFLFASVAVLPRHWRR